MRRSRPHAVASQDFCEVTNENVCFRGCHGVSEYDLGRINFHLCLQQGALSALLSQCRQCPDHRLGISQHRINH